MPPRDRERAARAIEEFLRALGHEPSAEPDLGETGRRVADAWIDELLAGEEGDPREILRAESFESPGGGGLVLLRDVEVATMCPHHLMPALGTATLAYVPGGRVAGLGALARALTTLARRMTLQERISQQFVEAVDEALEARGAACALRLRHGCLSARGAQSQAWVATFSATGVLAPGGEMHALLLGQMG